MELKPYLVDVPVKTNIWTREDCQKKQFEIIKQARPSILFIQSDGGRNEQEMEIIRRNRKMIDEGIDWDCTVHKLIADTQGKSCSQRSLCHRVLQPLQSDACRVFPQAEKG